MNPAPRQRQLEQPRSLEVFDQRQRKGAPMSGPYIYSPQLMCRFENLASSRGFSRIAGIDEAGRGALAGPVVAACVILSPNNLPPGINDSKKLSDLQRRECFDLIEKYAVSVGVGTAEPKTIDEINIYNATKLAMKKAVLGMAVAPDFLLIDAVKLYDTSISSLSLVQGDCRSVTVAAASIIAKVFRDNLMILLAEKYPAYGFSSHKGYCTASHRSSLIAYGPSEIHRFSFKPVAEATRLWKSKNQ